MKTVMLLCAAALIACGCAERRQGPFSRAGERVDEMTRNVEEGKNPLHKPGPVEKAGRAIDDTFDDDRDR